LYSSYTKRFPFSTEGPTPEKHANTVMLRSMYRYGSIHVREEMVCIVVVMFHTSFIDPVERDNMVQEVETMYR
jgi:hypothetical protein